MRSYSLVPYLPKWNSLPRETYDLLEQDIHNRNYEYEPPSIEIIRKVIEEYDAKKDAQEKGEGKKGRKKAREIID
jgi:hypothetical protein